MKRRDTINCLNGSRSVHKQREAAEGGTKHGAQGADNLCLTPAQPGVIFMSTQDYCLCPSQVFFITLNSVSSPT